MSGLALPIGVVELIFGERPAASVVQLTRRHGNQEFLDGQRHSGILRVVLPVRRGLDAVSDGVVLAAGPLSAS